MHVLAVNHTLDPVNGGGTAERTFQLARQLVRRGVECSLLTLDLGLTDERRKQLAGVELAALPCANRRFYVPRRIGRIRELVAAADVVHLMGHWTALNALVFRQARRMGKPHAFCSAGALPMFGRSRAIKRMYNAVVGRRLVQSAAAWIAISADEREHFRDYGVPPERVVHIPNGICPEHYLAVDDGGFRRRHQLGNGPLILFIGRLRDIKGPDLLLEAFGRVAAAHPRHTLVIAGPDDGLGEQLRRRATELQLANRVRFIGYVGGDEKSHALHAAEFLAIPSRQEAMSIVVLEGGASATPVLVTDQCGVDFVASFDGGCVVPASVAGLQRGLVEMIARDGERRAMGDRLQKHTSDHYSWDAIVERHIALFERIAPKQTIRRAA